nr:phosphoribosylformylglycinamidine cyclo-ligase [Synergistaceae bacterium]
GGFGGAFDLSQYNYKEPVLISGTDGVGTKLKIAFLLDKHDTVGIDCVAMCVNDVLCCGARPLFFLDYVAVGKNLPERVASIVSGVAEGCVQAECALIGGETAEMPGFYEPDEYDLAGFAVGIVEKSKILDNNNVKAGDIIIALPSSGLHSNGFSLVRKILKLDDINLAEKILFKYEEDFGKTLGEELLTPTKIYVKPVLDLINNNINIKSIAHITGGGFFENIPRSLNDKVSAKIFKDKIKILNIFKYLMREGNIDLMQMFNIFNMGVGMTLIISQDEADNALKILKKNQIDAYIIGEITDNADNLLDKINIV